MIAANDYSYRIPEEEIQRILNEMKGLEVKRCPWLSTVSHEFQCDAPMKPREKEVLPWSPICAVCLQAKSVQAVKELQEALIYRLDQRNTRF